MTSSDLRVGGILEDWDGRSAWFGSLETAEVVLVVAAVPVDWFAFSRKEV